MRIYALSDPHLSTAVDKPMDVFGKRWEKHDLKIIENWKKTVSDDDLVIVPGDISWGLKLEEAMPDFEVIHRLPGKKIILKGNHDLWWTSLNRMNSFFDNITFVHNTFYDAGGIAICGTRGWNLPFLTAEWTDHDEKIYRRELMRMDNTLKKAAAAGFERIITAVHYPVTDYRGSETDFTRIIEKYPVTDVIYGHLHGSEAEKNAFNGVRKGVKYRLVASDCIDFSPVLIYDSEV